MLSIKCKSGLGSVLKKKGSRSYVLPVSQGVKIFLFLALLYSARSYHTQRPSVDRDLASGRAKGAKRDHSEAILSFEVFQGPGIGLT